MKQPMLPSPSKERSQICLISVVNNEDDLQRFLDRRWYRIPCDNAGRSLSKETIESCDALALYQTRAITRNGLPSTIQVWGKISSVEIVSREELIPSEPYHPRAARLYYRIEVESVQWCSQPITNLGSVRVTFLRTPVEEFIRASDIRDLFRSSSLNESEALQFIEPSHGRTIYTHIENNWVQVDVRVAMSRSDMMSLRHERSAGENIAENFTGKGWNIVRFSPCFDKLESTGTLNRIMELMGVPIGSP